MKKYKKMNRSNTVIKAAQQIGTVFYRISEDDIDNVLDYSKNNLFLVEAFKMYGLNAFDIRRLWGSIIDGDYLYLCKTDGQEIQIGDELVDPEEALEEYGVESCQEYIQPANDSIIRQNLSEYELSKDIDVEDLAINLLQNGYSLNDIFRAADDIYILED